MNYSETYFKLDSEEATHSHQLSPIVTLSVVCILKGTCQHTFFDLGSVEIHEYKRSKQCRRCQRYSTDFKAMTYYVCQRHWRWCLWLLCNTAYRVLLLISLMSKTSKMPNTIVLCIQGLLPLQRGRHLMCLPPCGFSSSPPVSLRRQLCFKPFWDLSNYKGDCRQDAQPIPNS